MDAQVISTVPYDCLTKTAETGIVILLCNTNTIINYYSWLSLITAHMHICSTVEMEAIYTLSNREGIIRSFYVCFGM